MTTEKEQRRDEREITPVLQMLGNINNVYVSIKIKSSIDLMER